MGQYHLVVNLDKREFLNPHQLGCGLKLWEQLANHPSTGTALIALLAVSNGRGGGDLRGSSEVIGRWGGDRIAIVGDYAERDDLPPEFEAETIYTLCVDGNEIPDRDDIQRRMDEAKEDGREPYEWVRTWSRFFAGELKLYRNITPLVAKLIEHELQGEYVGSGWRNFQTDYIELSVKEDEAYNLLAVTKHDLPDFANSLAFTLDYRQKRRQM